MMEIILDASQIETFESCPKKWFYSYVQNLTTKHPNTALSTGSWLHEALNHYYTEIQRGRSPHMQIRHTLEYARSLTEGNAGRRWPRVRAEPQFHLERLKAYLFHWLNEDSNMEVIAVEKGFSYLLYEDDDRRYILEGMIDLVTHKPRMGLTVTDHKTQSRAYEKYFYNHQAMNYLIATGAAYFEYDYIGWQKEINENTFDRPIWAAPPDILDQWKLDVRLVFDQMYNMRYRPEYGKYQLGEDMRVGDFPRRRNSCQTKFGICEFHSICQVPDSSSWQPVVIQSKYTQKDERWKAWS